CMRIADSRYGSMYYSQPSKFRRNQHRTFYVYMTVYKTWQNILQRFIDSIIIFLNAGYAAVFNSDGTGKKVFAWYISNIPFDAESVHSSLFIISGLLSIVLFTD